MSLHIVFPGFHSAGGEVGHSPSLAEELPPPLDLGCHLTILSRYDTTPPKISKVNFCTPYKISG